MTSDDPNSNFQKTAYQAKIKKLERQLKFLHEKLGKFDLTVDQLNKEFDEMIQNEMNNSNLNPSTDPNFENMNIIGAVSEEDLKEIEILKYKYENGLELVKKEYEAEISQLNGKVNIEEKINEHKIIIRNK